MSSQPQTHPKSRLTAVLWTMCAALALVVAAVSALNVALPDLASEIGASQTDQLWISNAYALVFAGLLIPAGALGELFGRKRILLIGTAIFGLCAAGAAVATSAEALIALRAVQGAGAAMVMPVTLSIITAVFPPEKRSRAVGIWAGVAGAGGTFGLLAAGGLLEGFDWTSVFWLTTAIAALTFAAAVFLVPESRGRQTKFDPMGGLLSALGLGAIVFGVIEGPEWGWTDPGVLGPIFGGLAVLGAFVAWELRRDEPMLELRLFRNRAFAVGTLSTALQFFALFGFFYIVILYFQQVLGYSPLESGLALLPMGIGMMVFSPYVDRFVERFGSGPVAFAGLSMAGAGLLYGAFGLDVGSSYWAVLPMPLLIGAGLAFSSVPATLGILGGAPKEHQGMASAVNNGSREIGGALGIAVLGSLLNDRYASDVASSTRGLPSQVAEGSKESIGFANQAAAQLGERGDALMRGAEDAFISGFGLALVVGGGLLLATAVIALVFSPRKGELAMVDETEILAGGDEPAARHEPSQRTRPRSRSRASRRPPTAVG